MVPTTEVVPDADAERRAPASLTTTSCGSRGSNIRPSTMNVRCRDARLVDDGERERVGFLGRGDGDGGEALAAHDAGRGRRGGERVGRGRIRLT